MDTVQCTHSVYCVYTTSICWKRPDVMAHQITRVPHARGINAWPQGTPPTKK